MAKKSIKETKNEKVVKMSDVVKSVETKVSYHKASDIFGLKSDKLEFEVPVFEDEHEHVPEIDETYEFREDYLIPILWALSTNQKAWLSGHTGTGKSTLIKQICARLNWPLARVNFDSEISRMDLIGRDTLITDENGTTISKFVDGILPTAISDRYVLLCDEVDFIRPDVAYVMQRALEDEGLLISEDGGRVVQPHEFSRIVATGNTQGQGDDFGIYQGARSQSMAFLDRFTVWVTCEYLPENKERKLITESVDGITRELLDQVMKYTREHREAFLGHKISQPISPRSVMTLAEASVFFNMCDDDNPVYEAAKYTLLNKANATDRAVMDGLLNRITTSKIAARKAEEDRKKAKKAEYARRKAELEAKKKARELGIKEERVEMSEY